MDYLELDSPSSIYFRGPYFRATAFPKISLRIGEIGALIDLRRAEFRWEEFEGSI